MGFAGKTGLVDLGIAVGQEADFEQGCGELGKYLEAAVEQVLDVLLLTPVVVIGGVEGHQKTHAKFGFRFGSGGDGSGSATVQFEGKCTYFTV